MGDPGVDTQPIPRHESRLPLDHPLYRPRHGRQWLALVCASAFFLTPMAGLTIFGQPPSIENRAVHPFPSIADGWGFFTELGPWAVDNLSFRQGSINLTDAISRNVFGEPPPLGAGDPSLPGPIAPAPPTESPTQSNAPALDNEPPPAAGYLRVIEGRAGWLYFGYDTQGKCQPQQPLDDVIGNLVKLKQAVESSGRKFVLIVPPDKSTVVPQNLPDQYAGRSCANAYRARFWPKVTGEAGAVDLRPALERAGSSVYFPQDTHWTWAGGLIMARELAGNLRPGVDLTWRVTSGGKSSGPADLPPMIGRTGTDDGERYRLAPDGGVDRAQQGPFDFRNTVTFHTGEPVTGMVTGKTAMVADSFSNYASPYLAAVFADINITQSTTVQQDPAAQAQRLVDSDTVVVEQVERNLAAGISPMTQPAVVDVLTRTLAAHPRR